MPLLRDRGDRPGLLGRGRDRRDDRRDGRGDRRDDRQDDRGDRRDDRGDGRDDRQDTEATGATTGKTVVASGPDCSGKPSARRSSGPRQDEIVRACPLRARAEEPPRTVTVSHGQHVSRLAGQPMRRWRHYSATDFPS